jgi:hypothetical protein
LTMKTSELAGISRDFRGKTSGVFCTADCVAERVGFEPSVRFCHAKPRHVRKLQITRPYQRISHQTRRGELCNQSGFASPSIRTRRRTPGDSVAKSGQPKLR